MSHQRTLHPRRGERLPVIHTNTLRAHSPAGAASFSTLAVSMTIASVAFTTSPGPASSQPYSGGAAPDPLRVFLRRQGHANVAVLHSRAYRVTANNTSMSVVQYTSLQHPALAENQAEETGAEVAALHIAYEAEDWNAVDALLNAHPELVGLLAEARAHVSGVFGEAAPVRLKLVPEDGDELHSLFADVHTADDPMVAYEKLNRFEDEWWLDASERAQGLLHFSVEFA